METTVHGEKVVGIDSMDRDGYLKKKQGANGRISAVGKNRD